ncbi:hypothetical protein [Halohasta salina]|uniref:hypothetical protein n=1 Tax=Halohasta salina TaxID=2961621 RepID=UPI0020A2D45B|nr:hypothetical protein [Halohasta salina]
MSVVGRLAVAGSTSLGPSGVDGRPADPDSHRPAGSIPVASGWRPQRPTAPDSTARHPSTGFRRHRGSIHGSTSTGGRRSRSTDVPLREPELTPLGRPRPGVDRRVETGTRTAARDAGRTDGTDRSGVVGRSRWPPAVDRPADDASAGVDSAAEGTRSGLPRRPRLAAGSDAGRRPTRTRRHSHVEDLPNGRRGVDGSRRAASAAAGGSGTPLRRSALGHRSRRRSTDPAIAAGSAAAVDAAADSPTLVGPADSDDPAPGLGRLPATRSAATSAGVGHAPSAPPSAWRERGSPTLTVDTRGSWHSTAVDGDRQAAARTGGRTGSVPPLRMASSDSAAEATVYRSAERATADRDPTVLSVADSHESTADADADGPTTDRSAAGRTVDATPPMEPAATGEQPRPASGAPTAASPTDAAEDGSTRQRPRLTFERSPARQPVDRDREAGWDRRRSAGRSRQRSPNGRSPADRSPADRSADPAVDGSPSRGDRLAGGSPPPGDRTSDGPPTENDRSAAGSDPFGAVQRPESRPSTESARQPERATDRRAADRAAGRSGAGLPGAESLAYDADVDRLVETLYRRLERRVRIERERTGF